MNYKCPICSRDIPLTEHKILYQDYVCKQDSHMYVHRVRNDQIHQIKIRLSEPDGSKIFCKIMYDQNKSEVWTGTTGTINNRIQIDNVFELDFSDLDKLKKKIKTYMLFS